MREGILGPIIETGGGKSVRYSIHDVAPNGFDLHWWADAVSDDPMQSEGGFATVEAARAMAQSQLVEGQWEGEADDRTTEEDRV